MIDATKMIMVKNDDNLFLGILHNDKKIFTKNDYRREYSSFTLVVKIHIPIFFVESFDPLDEKFEAHLFLASTAQSEAITIDAIFI